MSRGGYQKAPAAARRRKYPLRLYHFNSDENLLTMVVVFCVGMSRIRRAGVLACWRVGVAYMEICGWVGQAWKAGGGQRKTRDVMRCDAMRCDVM